MKTKGSTSDYHLVPEKTKIEAIIYFIKNKNNSSRDIAERFGLSRTNVEKLFTHAFKKKLIVKEWNKALIEYALKKKTI